MFLIVMAEWYVNIRFSWLLYPLFCSMLRYEGCTRRPCECARAEITSDIGTCPFAKYSKRFWLKLMRGVHYIYRALDNAIPTLINFSICTLNFVLFLIFLICIIRTVYILRNIFYHINEKQFLIQTCVFVCMNGTS